MSDLESFRGRAIAWLDLVAADFGRDARRGLTEADDLALGRRYMAAKYEAGFAGINWPVDSRVRSAIARNHALRRGLEAITARAMKMMEAGMEPGPEGSLNKLFSVRSRQRLSELAIDLRGNTGFGFDPHAFVKEDWTTSWLNAPTGRIAGGADEMLLNTIAEKILGLPQDHRPDKGVPFNHIPA